MTGRSRVSGSGNMDLTELRELYDRALESGADAAYRKRRWGRAAEFASWLEQDPLAALEPQQALLLYRASGGRAAAAFSATPIEEVRDSLDFLLYDTIKLEGRFDESASPDGGFFLAGTGSEFVSWLLCVRDPALFGVWNRNAERMLRRVGVFPESMKRGPLGIRYLDLLEALARLRAGLGLRDFIEVDVAAYLSARPRGRQGTQSESEGVELKNALA